MGTNGRRRAVAIASTVVVVVGTLALVAPSSGASSPTAVRLHLGTSGRYFAYGDGPPQQVLTMAKNGCQITSAEPLIDLSSTPNNSSPGLGPDGIGVKRSPSSGNGSPCTQVDNVETLTLSRGPDLGGRRFTGVRLDLEVTGNAIVTLTFASITNGVRTTLPPIYNLQTGGNIELAQTQEPGYDNDPAGGYLVSSTPGDIVDACAAPNSSGPNSAANDNCQWTVLPGFEFDAITITTTTVGGTVALEGGGDYGASVAAFESLLYLGNTPATANADSFTTNEDTAYNSIADPLKLNVLTNDLDPDGDGLTASLVTPPAHGTVTLQPDGKFVYTPAPDYNGPDSFTYAAADSPTTSSNATVSITVTAVNDPPVAVNSAPSTPEETAITVLVATDVEGGVLTAVCTSPQGGTIVDNHNGNITFTPPTDFNGTITVTCQVTDDHGATTTTSAVVTVGVTGVNDPPVAVNDLDDADQDGFVDIDVLANDTDVDPGDTLTVHSVGAALPAGASAVLLPGGLVRYTPPPGFTGQGSFTYQATDGEATSNAATVTVTVLPVQCGGQTVSTQEPGPVSGSFTRLDPNLTLCKRYIAAVTPGETPADDPTILFQPEDTPEIVRYRGVLTLPADPVPPPGGSGEHPLLLEYDPLGGFNFQPVQWCIFSDEPASPQFDANGLVIGATLPPGESWCVASAVTQPGPGGLVTTWQAYGEDDPRWN